MIPISNHVEQERNTERMLKYGLTRSTEINNKEKLLQLINDTLEQSDNIRIDDEIYNEFRRYDGRENALNIIQNNYYEIKQI